MVSRNSYSIAAGIVASIGMLAGGIANAQQIVKFGVAAVATSHANALMGVVAPEIFAKHGLKLELTDFRGNSNNCMAGILTSAVEVCQLGTTSGADAIAEGASLKGLAVIIAPIPEIVLSAKTVAKFGNVGPGSSVEDRLRALKGTRLVTTGPGTPNYVALDTMLKKVGMSIADVQFRTLGDPIAMVEGIRNDQIDGAMWSAGPLAGLIGEKTGVRWISVAAGDIPELRSMPFVTVFSTEAWYVKNQATAIRLHDAMADAIAAMKKEPAKYSGLLKAKYFPDMNQAVWDDGYGQALKSFFDGARAPKAGWDFQLSLQAQSTKKDYSKAAWDKTLIPEAQSR